MWSLILVFGVAALIFIVLAIVAIHDRDIIPLPTTLLLAFAISCGYVGIAAPIAGMICGNNTIC